MGWHVFRNPLALHHDVVVMCTNETLYNMKGVHHLWRYCWGGAIPHDIVFIIWRFAFTNALIICSSLSSSWTMTSANVFVDVHDSWHVSRWLESCPRRYEMRGSWYLRSLYWMRSAAPFLVQTPRAFNSRRSWASCCSYHLQGNRSTFVSPDSAFSKSRCISLSK